MTYSTDTAHALRETNKSIFAVMLEHLGRKEFDAFEQYLAPDIFQDWPYLPIPNMPSSLVGSKNLRELIESGSMQFDPYAYRIQEFYDLHDPTMLIVEYTSHTVYRPTGKPYHNAYIAIVRFDNEKITRWREYLNPLIIKETMLGDFEKPIPSLMGGFERQEGPSLTVLDQLLAIENIKTLKARYFRYLDGKDEADLASLFMPDGVLDMRHASAGSADESALISGSDAIARFILTAVSGAKTVHHGHMPEIFITSSSTAEGVWAMQDLLKWDENSPYHFRELIGYGHYHDNYCCVDGKWYIQSSRLTRMRIDLKK